MEGFDYLSINYVLMSEAGQIDKGLNRDTTYSSEYKAAWRINSTGLKAGADKNNSSKLKLAQPIFSCTH